MTAKKDNVAGKSHNDKKIVFIVTEDWFFASHFLPLAREAVRSGYTPFVVTRIRDHRQVIEATGAMVVPLELHRRHLNPIALIASIRKMIVVLESAQPSIVHCISLRSIMVGGIAAALTGCNRRVFAVTGWGYLAAKRNFFTSTIIAFIRAVLRGPLQSDDTIFLFENQDDPKILGFQPDDPAVAIVGGAGIDPAKYSTQSFPPAPPLRLALVARMLWSKGVDVAVEAVRLAHAAGAAVELSLIGPIDPSNPKSIDEATLRDWSREPFISWRGAVNDIPSVWQEHHVACLPSRGGEGLPRTLLESASCGRLALTTDVPGCRTFVRHGVDGYVLPVGDIEALAAAIVELAADPARVLSMGQRAAERVRNGYTEEDVASAVGVIYRQRLSCIGEAAAGAR